MVEVFKTDISIKEDAERVVHYLHHYFPLRANVDLHDCDKILRVEAAAVPVQDIRELVSNLGFFCELLE
jgi:hypothetical protein